MNALLTIAFLSCLVGGLDDDKIVKPEDVKDHIGKKITVEFEVKSSKFSERSKTTFLNSEKDFRSEKNFQVVIFTDGYERFQAVKIENPADHFKGKKVRVTGTIRKSKETKDYKNRLEIKLVEPDNIKIVSRESSSDNSESEKDGKEGKDGKDKPTTESPNKKPADKDSSKE